MNHQILSPYTAFVGVETTGPKIDSTDLKIRHIPIQVSKGDEHLLSSQTAYSSSYRGGLYGPPMPMAMAAMPMPAFGNFGGSQGYVPPQRYNAPQFQYRLGP